MRRDSHFLRTITVGCIGTTFLCIIAVVLLYFQLFQPQLMWFYGDEIESALNRYEQIRVDVMKGDKPESALEMIAVNPHLEELQNSFGEVGFSVNIRDAQPITVNEIREFSDRCAVVIVRGYHDISEVAFVLIKFDNFWKVRQIYTETQAGLAPLPLKIC